MNPMTPKQVAGLTHHPDRTVKRLVATALKAMERCDELAAENRRLQEEKAAEEVEKPPILILADHKGGIEVKAEVYHRVKVIPIHEADSRNPDEEDDDARKRTPLSHKHLWDAKTIATGHTGLDRYRRAVGEAVLSASELLHEME
jgi:hypothetical protein